MAKASEISLKHNKRTCVHAYSKSNDHIPPAQHHMVSQLLQFLLLFTMHFLHLAHPCGKRLLQCIKLLIDGIIDVQNSNVKQILNTYIYISMLLWHIFQLLTLTILPAKIIQPIHKVTLTVHKESNTRGNYLLMYYCNA